MVIKTKETILQIEGSVSKALLLQLLFEKDIDTKKKSPPKKSGVKKKAAKKPAKKSSTKTNKLGVKNSLVNNLNARKKKGVSHPKSRKTVSKTSYQKMEENWQ